MSAWDKVIANDERELLRDIRITLSSMLTVQKQQAALLSAILDATNFKEAKKDKHGHKK